MSKVDENVAISVSHASKNFKLPHDQQNSLKGRLIHFRERGYEIQSALDDISFDVRKGEFLGILGRNGSGKSTLLKMLAGIYSTNGGDIKINGKLTPFIELGVGFNPELTGRDNVFLNGALLGFNRIEMNALYDDIVSFAEIERFMDQKLKNYSSGMQVRLAFSIAIRADTDILVLDEVLAVGDEAFQRKCYDYFDELKRRGKTVVLVTHDMSAVQRFCTRAIVIDSGNIIYDGKTDGAAKVYRNLNLLSTEKSTNDNNKRQTEKNEQGEKTLILSTYTLDTEGAKKVLFEPEEKLVISTKLKLDSITKPSIQMWFKNPGGLAISLLRISHADLVKHNIDITKEFTVDWTVDGIFNDGRYIVSVEVDEGLSNKLIEVIDNAGEFVISGWDTPNVLVHSINNYTVKQ